LALCEAQIDIKQASVKRPQKRRDRTPKAAPNGGELSVIKIHSKVVLLLATVGRG